MLKLCSWCGAKIGCDANLKGKSHGICLNCFQRFFPNEYATMTGKRKRS